MKTVILISSTVLFMLFGCYQHTIAQNHFSSSTDTIIIQMQQNPGRGFIKKSRGINELHFKNSLEYDVIVPEKIENIQLALEIADYNIATYKRIISESENGEISEFCQNLINDNKIDTSKILSREENSVCFLQGVREGEEIFIVDENFNKDFRDDSIRVKKLMDFSSVDDLIKCYYKIYNGKEYVMTSNWINVGRWKFGKDELWFLANQHYNADFTVDESSYKLEYYTDDARFWFYEPTFALINFDGIQVDTITDGELLSINEYLRLKEGDYKIHRLSNDGTNLTLLRNTSFAKIDGTQIGMLAPTFICQTTTGDLIESGKIKGKFMLLANVSACYSPVSSYKCYKDLTEKYKDKIEILCLDKSPVVLANNIKALGLKGKFIDVNKNEDLQKYRPMFCSRTCFLISPNGRIQDKFEIFNWEQSMKKHFDKN